MHPSRHPATVVATGLVAAQVIATLQVYRSNIELKGTLLRLETEGYLPVPNPQIADRLGELGPALVGGLFFTFSIGAGLSILALGLSWCWDRALNRSIGFGTIAGASWLTLLVQVNWHGFAPMTSLYFVVVPLVVSFATVRWLHRTNGTTEWKAARAHVIPFLVLAALWSSTWRASAFVDVRDHLLLSSAPGAAINDVYYAYTLYPARVLRSPEQKLLRTVRLEGFREAPVEGAVDSVLRHYDYLRMTGPGPVDLSITNDDGQLAFHSRRQLVHETTLDRFMTGPLDELRAFSVKADAKGSFRQLTFYGLALGFPIVLYLFSHGALRLVLKRVMTEKRASVLATGLTCTIGCALLLVLYAGRSTAPVRGDVQAHLDSTRWQDQVAALQTVTKSGTQWEGPVDYSKLAASSDIAVRYWLAVALASGQGDDDLDAIVGLLNDASPNVVSKALLALGERGDRTHIDLVRQTLETSDHWYVQLHAYQALRALGWKQVRSD